jgi:hypothetical protein
MRKLVIGITGAVGLLLAGIFVWNAEATPLAGSAIIRSAANYSLVEKAACVRQGPFSRCPLGQHWQGGACVPCMQGLVCSDGTPYLCHKVVQGRLVSYCSPTRC